MKKSIFKRVAASAAAMALALVGVVALGSKAEVKAAVTEVDLSDLTGYTLTNNVFKVCESWSDEVVIDEDVNVSFQLTETESKEDMIAIQLLYCDGGWAWHHDYVDAVYSADETYKVTVPAGTYHIFQIAPSSAKDAAGDDAGSLCWQYDFKNVTTTTGEEEAEDDAAYYVAGEEALCGKNWDPAGSLMEKNADGTYSVTFTGIAAGSYEFKVTDGTWDNSWNLDGNANTAGNAWVDVEEDDSTVVITFDGERVSVAVNPVAEDPEDPEDPATEDPEDPATEDPEDPATDVPSGDSAQTALIIALVFAGAASVAAVVSKKVTIAEK